MFLRIATLAQLGRLPILCPASREFASLLNILRKLRSKHLQDATQGQENANEIKPESPFFAIGDIHGRADLLRDLLAQINPANDHKLVFLGDYVDRGPDSADTLNQLFELAKDKPEDVICLMGNHEQMLIDFIDDPLWRGSNWLRNGGSATLASFGIKGVPVRPEPDCAIEASVALERALPRGMLEWLRSLPLHWNSGNIWCVHAAMDPATPPRAQRTKTMLWGHPNFLSVPRNDGVCVVHGHTAIDDPTNMNSRIAIDTGAYRTDRLTAAHVTTGQCRFLST